MSLNIKALTKLIVSQEPKEESKEELRFSRDIAIIGVSCRFADAANKEEYWQSLVQGKDHIRPFPEDRERLNQPYLAAKKAVRQNDPYYEAGFLEQVDRFDYDFFSLSPKEASLMSPSQRLFLESAWEAIEDAGYGGGLLQNSLTGIFLGHSTDFGVSYKEFIESSSPDDMSVSISGNINSIIASRISYLLNLQGPSLVVDTACSSSLVAVHQACRSIRSGDCDLALAGSVKVDLLPLTSIKAKEDEIGITSSDSRARTFDDSSEGTGLGEGVAAILLKPLSQALADGDHIYALIKGSAINQDGTSAGLTAPNPSAQSDVIERAWKDAGIDPETIGYFEAHGTGTNLGDPIEISGIEEAMSRYTDKKQFCAIGSVKTNLGHLDHAAGIAGMVKAILALKKRMLPASLHFQKPNKRINFETSPVYVNDQLRPWIAGESPRRCGISSFGLSGTNCHVILEEAAAEPADVPGQIHSPVRNQGQNLLTLSAKGKEGLLDLVREYQLRLYTHGAMDLRDMCYTANTGRGHYSHRLAVLFDNQADLQLQLDRLSGLDVNKWQDSVVLYGEHRIVSENQTLRKKGELTRTEKLKLTQTGKEMAGGASLSIKELVQIYLSGGDINWQVLYEGEDRKRLSLPTYPFARTSCWVKASEEASKGREGSPYILKDSHPLFDACLSESYDRVTYLSVFSAQDHWVLSEHLVAGSCVAPGTIYLEMALELARRYFPNRTIQLSDVLFLTPFSVQPGERKELQTILTKEKDRFHFAVMSRFKQQWTKHAEGTIVPSALQQGKAFEITTLKKQCSGGDMPYYPYETANRIETGPHWNCIREVKQGSRSLIADLSLEEAYTTEALEYNLHPALMDEAVNVALRSLGEELYLPFSYKRLTMYRSLPSDIYSYIKKKSADVDSPEIATFDVHLLDKSGNELVFIEDYSIKKVSGSLVYDQPRDHKNTYNLNWKKSETPLHQQQTASLSTLIIEQGDSRSNRITVQIQSIRKDVIVAGESYRDDYDSLANLCKERKVEQIIHLSAFAAPKEAETLDDYQVQESRGIYSLYHLTKALVKAGLEKAVEIVLVAPSVRENPHHASMFGLGRVIGQEYSKLNCRCIEVCDLTDEETIVSEINSISRDYWTLYEGGERFIQELSSTDLQEIPDQPVAIQDDGVYIITGGAGGLGLEIAKDLASRNRVRLVCINRSAFPAEEDWEQLCNTSTDQKLIYKIRRAQEIRASGSTIGFFRADVSSRSQMEAVLDTIRSQYGAIRGIIHAAGVAGDGFIIRREQEIFDSVLAPKTRGTWILDTLTVKDNLDFLILFSSITSFLAGQGQGDYCAANSYLDAYTLYRNHQGRRTLTINWAAWEEVGMAHDYGVSRDSDMFLPIEIKGALEAFHTVLTKQVQRVIIGELNSHHPSLFDDSLGFKIDPSIMTSHGEDNFGFQVEEAGDDMKEESFRITLTGRSVDDPYTDWELRIAQVLGHALGQKEINIYDTFYEIGGNSILAVKVETLMEKADIPIGIFELFEKQTVKALAEHVFGPNDRTPDSEEPASPDVNLADRQRVEGIEDSGVILDNIEPFNDLFYKDCFHNSLFPVLSFFEKKFDIFSANDLFWYQQDGMTNHFEKTIAALLAELGIGVSTATHYTSKQNEEVITEQDKRLLEDFSGNIGMEATRPAEDIEQLIPRIKNAVLQGNPVIVWVDCYYEPIRQDTFHQDHWMHSLLVYGFDDDKKIFNIIEHSFRGNLTYRPQTIGYEDLQRSYEGFLANYLPYTNMPSYYEFLNNTDKSGQEERDYREVFKRNRRNHQDQLAESLKQLKAITDKFHLAVSDEEHLKEEADGCMEILNSVIACKQIEVFNIRKLFGDDEPLTQELETILNHWNYVRHLIVRYTFTSDYKLKDITERLNSIYPAEIKYSEQLSAKMQPASNI
ncbi:SDR family NAD(P)-dependent oxidoreductase [Paenibacillus lutrae]|uniref:SDR family NAD(P)-dependent oxidoreductase n=1 Tax=Paenibacillus lutrae TaxID=2078573 RepID=A0A7X3FFG4_9BACL|nr:SDR family NAD(P)-dependent oxidoreductase [Paenibacillus lutrae]MVO98607.1 SDR family NAD(P)-dependent oxidoreductase [Paenibacillus lutrae]